MTATTIALHIVLGIYCTSHYIYTKIQAKFLSNRDERAPLVASRAIRVRLGHFASYCYSCTARVSTRVLWRSAPLAGAARGSAQRPKPCTVLFFRVSYQNTSLFRNLAKYTNIPHVCCPNFDSIPIYLILGVRYTNIPHVF